MNPNWLFLIVPAAVLFGVFAAYYTNTYRGMDDRICPTDGHRCDHMTCGYAGRCWFDI